MNSTDHLLGGTARDLVAPSKGILAADESTPTIGKRFAAIGVESTEESRRRYREMLFTTKGLSETISGVIFYDETLRQRGDDGVALADVLEQQGIIPGIKVDRGTQPLAGSSGETVTEGLDGLRDRLNEYRDLGARFTKWRAVLQVGPARPTRYCIATNAHALGRFAALSQETGLVPIVEPEVLMDGVHGIERCLEVTESALREVFYELGRHHVLLEGMLLKASMVISGSDAANRADAREVAAQTVACMKRTVPPAVPGIVFLSGGQSDDEATVNLDAINRRAKEVGAPWELSFSYGRGLQAEPLRVWGGLDGNVKDSQGALYRRAFLTSAARQGEFTPGMEADRVPRA